MPRLKGLLLSVREQLTPRRLMVVLVVLASLGALAYGILANWQELVTYDWQLTYWPLLVALLLYPPALAIAVLVWRLILGQVGGATRYRDDLRVFCSANLARRLPTPAWFIAGRVYMNEELGVAKSVTSLALILEAVVILFSGIVGLLLFVPLGVGGEFLRSHLWVVVLLFVTCLLVVFRPSVLSRITNWRARRWGGEGITAQVGYQQMVGWTLLYLVVWVLGGGILYCLVRAAYPLGLVHLPSVIGAWVSAGVVSHVAIVTPGGLGIKELTMASLLSTVMPLPVAVVVSVVARLWYSLNELLWFFIALRIA